jgi:hypothetical protein
LDEETCREFSRAFATAEFLSEVKVKGDNPDSIVQTVTGKGNDPADLLQLLRGQLQLGRCTFSWDRKRFEISGFPPRPQGSLASVVLAVVVAGAVCDPHYKNEIVLTTDGRFIVDHMPCEIEADGRRLVLDVSKLDESPEQERSLKIEGLGE